MGRESRSVRNGYSICLVDPVYLIELHDRDKPDRPNVSQTRIPSKFCWAETVFLQPSDIPCRTYVTGSSLTDPHLFVPECFDRIEASGLVGRVQSEEEADHE